MMFNRLFHFISLLAATLLLLFTARRWLFMLTALKSTPRTVAKTYQPHVLLLVPIRNEAIALPGLLHALSQLDYPASRLTIGLINDGSIDESAAIIHEWVTKYDHWHSLTLPHNVGKANALNAALAHFPQGDIVSIYDADERPMPDALAYLVAPFIDEHVGAVSGRRVVANALASPAASYTAFEGLVHQLITLQAKDKLQLAPALLGANCAYRRAALTQVGNFKPHALLEDTDLTLKLARAGWRIRFEPRAYSSHDAPTSLMGYWRQHSRWARGFNDAAQAQGVIILSNNTLSWPLRLELLLFSLGYLDRVALVVVAFRLMFSLHRVSNPMKVLSLSGLFYLLLLTLFTPLLQILAALKIEGAPWAMWGRVIWLPLFFGLDISMAVWGAWQTLRRATPIWEERAAR